MSPKEYLLKLIDQHMCILKKDIIMFYKAILIITRNFNFNTCQ